MYVLGKIHFLSTPLMYFHGSFISAADPHFTCARTPHHCTSGWGCVLFSLPFSLIITMYFLFYILVFVCFVFIFCLYCLFHVVFELLQRWSFPTMGWRKDLHLFSCIMYCRCPFSSFFFSSPYPISPFLLFCPAAISWRVPSISLVLLKEEGVVTVC